jgi:stage II sporulation protein GA (sporulation sigma-E factor processing peptidase)
VSPNTNIYIDMVFLINFIMDFFVLWAAGKFGRLTTTFKNLCLGAFIGALYAVLIFVPQLSFTTTFIAKVICSLLMVRASFGFGNFRRFLKSAAYFYLVSFIMGGAVLGSMYLFDDSLFILETWNGIAVSAINFKTAWLLVGLIIALILGLWGASYIRQNLQQGPWLVKAYLEIFGQVIETDALVDTGNQLNDPITKEPVMVIEHNKLSGILPPQLIAMFNKKDLPSLDEQITTLKDPKWNTRIRLIPFSSLGNQNGMLLGIKPESVLIKDGSKTYANQRVVLGIYNRKLSSEGIYQALVHPDMLAE